MDAWHVILCRFLWLLGVLQDQVLVQLHHLVIVRLLLHEQLVSAFIGEILESLRKKLPISFNLHLRGLLRNLLLLGAVVVCSGFGRLELLGDSHSLLGCAVRR